MARQWIRRLGSGTAGFRYVDVAGRPVRDVATRERIDRLRIPPAWTDVRIAANPRAPIQAWGLDAKGRRQYRYHARAIERGDRRKYYRVRQLARDLPAIRAAIARDFRGPALDRRRVSAGVLRLISEGFLRVGSERHARENRTFGITTLRKSHARVDGDCVVFRYAGKRAIEQRQVVVARDLARFVARLLDTPGRRLFRYRAGGRWRDLVAPEVNDYLREVTGFPYTAKDFRTWGGTLRAATVLAELGPPRTPTEGKRNVALAMRLVSSELGNTPVICRKSYVHPVIIDRYLASDVVAIRSPFRGATPAEPRFAHTAEERALIAFLEVHFPDRRRRPRPAASVGRGPARARAAARSAR